MSDTAAGPESAEAGLAEPTLGEKIWEQVSTLGLAVDAYFDTVAAMGGDGGAGRWRKSTPPLLSGDLAHLTHAGQKVVGHMLYLALMEGYVAYRERTD